MAEPLRKLIGGVPYTRPEEVELEINQLLELTGNERLRRMSILYPKDAEYVRSECLLYFIRQTRSQNSELHFETLFKLLLRRVKRALPGAGRRNTASTIDAAEERAAENVEARFLEFLSIDAKGYDDRLDFFEAKFAAAFLALRRTALSKMYKEKSREAPAPEDGEVPTEFSKSGNSFTPFSLEKYSDPLYRIRLGAAIKALPDVQRKVLVLDMHDVPYTSKDPTVATVGSLVGCGEQTARHHRDRAYAALKIALEGGKDE
jgi:hypothetical protein